MTTPLAGPSMALLLATDDWSKMQILQNFLEDHDRAIWRTGHRHNRALREICFPIPVYFFHRNIIRYRARCVAIHRGQDWTLSDVPPEFRSDTKPYALYLVIDRLERVPDTHIHGFRKWGNPAESFHRGLLGLLKVQNELAGEPLEPS